LNSPIDEPIEPARSDRLLDVFTEPAVGTTVAGLKKLVEEGRIDPDERTVVYMTGNGLKAQDTLIKQIKMLQAIKPTFGEFEKQYEQLVVAQ